MNTLPSNVDLTALAGHSREDVHTAFPLDEEDGLEQWAPFHELALYFGPDDCLKSGHVFFLEPQTEARAFELLTDALNVRVGDACAVTLHPCVHRPEIISAHFIFTV